MCGCKGKNNNRQALQARMTAATEPTTDLVFIGIGTGLMFVGNKTKTRYQNISTNTIISVYNSDVANFLSYVQYGKKIFEIYEPIIQNEIIEDELIELEINFQENNVSDDSVINIQLEVDDVVVDEINLQETKELEPIQEVIEEKETVKNSKKRKTNETNE